MGTELLQELGGVCAGMQSEEIRAGDEHAAEGTACCTEKLGGNNCSASCGDENMGPELLQELGGVCAGMNAGETQAGDEGAAEGTACCTGKLGGNNC
jgi:hypothetical protein